MSHLFYDHLVNLKELEKFIKKSSETPEEKEEYWRLIDEMVHHRILGCIFDNLPKEHHNNFLVKLKARPHDQKLMDYLKSKIQKNIEELIQQEITNFESEILKQ